MYEAVEQMVEAKEKAAARREAIRAQIVELEGEMAELDKHLGLEPIESSASRDGGMPKKALAHVTSGRIGSSYTPAEVADAIRCTNKNAVGSALAKFATQGMLVRERSGKSYKYRSNSHE